ncbi:RnfH family protein [Legionella sp. CNM-4043-24]|uniref:RnfH family protein n=1 Tax=Legionella sp. CNM-4043-24 TaxID=3421646 RepID=UPI00403A87EA
MFPLEIVYVTARQELVRLHCDVAEGCTVEAALSQSGIWNTHPETRDMVTGIYSKRVSADTVLKPGDRLEIYRPLVIDPKEKRRQRAAKSKS